MGSSGSGGGSTANVFIPPGQAGAAGALGNLVAPLYGLAGNAGAGTPAAWAYPQAQGFFPAAYNSVAQYLAPFGGGRFDELSGNAVGAAQNAGNIYGQLMPDIYNNTSRLMQGVGQGLDYLGMPLAQGFDPLYGQMTQATLNNPYFSTAMGGAQQAAGLGQAGADQLYGAGTQLLQSGFDPQSALFNRSQQQLIDQSNAINAMSGVGGSPYGAGVTSNALGNFDINWQNQQLARQAQAAGAASPLFQAAPGLAATSAAAPSNTYLGQINAVLNALGQQNKAGILGISGFNDLLKGAGSGLTQAGALGQNLAQNTAQFGMLPYQTGATIGNNATSSINNLLSLLTGTTNLGNDQFKLPEDVAGMLMKYMGLGQDASRISGQLGQMGFNQMAQGFGGALSGANTLFNPTSGMFPGLLGGGAASAVPDLASTIAVSGGFEPAVGGGLSSMLPLALSA